MNNDSSSEDDTKVYESLSKLPPANQLLPRQLTIDIDVKSLYPLKYNSQLLDHSHNSILSTHLLIQNIYILLLLLNLPLRNVQHFQITMKTINRIQFIRGSTSQTQGNVLQENAATLPPSQPVSRSIEYIPTSKGEGLYDQKCVPCLPDQLTFDSNFESGNLFCAFRKGDSVYDLVLQNDINTRGNTQWFFFSVSGAKAGQTVQFNIMNHLKSGSLFNDGLQPAVYSMKERELTQTEWTRSGFNISYFKSAYIKEYPIAQRRKYYQLRFSYTFKHDYDKVYFAHSYPYTYTNLLTHLNTILSDQERNIFMARKVLCHTLTGNTCDVLTITSNSIQRRAFRKGVVFMARQHPGEPQGSYVMQGIIDFLVSSDPQAEYLRNNCIFKIFPMMNTDGVINGNYRCGLEGSDLNRRWKKPNKRLHPSVYYAKKYIKGFSKERQVVLVMDLHGHSRKQSSFVYGCAYSSQSRCIERVFALLMSKLNPMVSYPSCTFRVENAKDKTARIQLWRELKISWVYTYECSFYGQDKQHFSIRDYLNSGLSICQALAQIVRDTSKEFTNQQNLPDIQNHLLEELAKMPQTDDQDTGSDSSQSENGLSDDELVGLFNPKAFTLKQKNVLKQQQQQQQQQQKKPVKNLQKTSLLSESPVKELQKPPLSSQKPKNGQYRIQGPRKQVEVAKTPEPSVLMVDKCVQTDEYMYRQWLIQMGKTKKQQEYQSFTPTRNIYKSSSQSVTRFIVKNGSTRNQDRGRVDSISLMASGFQNKLMSSSQQRQMMKYSSSNFMS